MRQLFKTKFLISLQSSGRRWLCNVIGHYDALARGERISPEDGASCSNPLIYYGTQDRMNLVPTHCVGTIGGKIAVPKLFRFRPSIILIRHPAKVAYSHFRTFQSRNSQINYSVEEYLDRFFTNFYIEYSNKVYKYIGHKNHVFLAYQDLLAEQNLEVKPNWELANERIFGCVDRKFLTEAIYNNSAFQKSPLAAKKYIKRTPPAKLNEFYDEELYIAQLLRPKLQSELNPSIARYFNDKGLI